MPADRAEAGSQTIGAGVDTPSDLFEIVVTPADDRLLFTVALDGHPAVLDLAPSSVRGPTFRVLTDDGTGVLTPAQAPPPSTYLGTVAGMPGSRVAARWRDGELSALVLGTDSSSSWSIDPAGAGGLHRATPLDEITLAGWVCGTEHLGEIGAALGVAPGGDEPAPRGPGCLTVADIDIDADFEFYQLNGSDLAATIADIESIINAMNLIYARDVLITHEVDLVVVRQDANDPYTTTDAGGRLNEFRTEWLNNFAGEPRDAAHFFTGVDIDSNIIGVAWVGVICNFDYAYGLSQSRFTSSFAARVALTAHEVGHNWNAPHCNGDPDCSIMCSGLGGCSGILDIFGSQAAEIIRDFALSRTCTTIGPGWPDPLAPHAGADSAATADAITLDVLANDYDGNCDSISLDSFDATSTLGGTVTLSVGTGPGGRDELVYDPPAGGSGTDSFAYVISDDGGTPATGSVTITLLNLREPDAVGTIASGIPVAYYDLVDPQVLPDFDLLMPFGGELVSQINFPSTSGVFAGSGRSDNFGAVYTGLLVAPADGVYELSLESDDGSRLLIGNQVVVDNDGLHGMVEQTGAIGLKAGPHMLRVELFERGGGAGLIARWQSGAIAKEVIPASGFVHEVPCPADLTGSIDPNDPGYGVPDGVVDANDFFFYLDLFSAGDVSADLTGSIDPNDPGYGVPDGTLDSNDFFFYLALFSAGCS